MGFFIKTVSESDATGKLREYYNDDIKTQGIPSNTTRTFSLLPETWEGWTGLVKCIRKNMRLRNYELATFAAAMEMGCTF